jgi:hypothetical protein
MIFLILNGIFAGLAFGIARTSVNHAWPLLRVGWTAIDAAVSQPDFRHNVESRRQISEGGFLLLSGIAWAIGALIALGAAIFFSVEVIRLL